jgi:HPr kinase/phosphorylase
MIVAGGESVPEYLHALADTTHTALFASPLDSVELMWMLRPYLARALAESTTMHGVLLDVLGMGVMITGDSAVGKSELALELISRGSGLIADDVIELYRIAPETLEGRCPSLLCDFLEVRGLGVLNIRTIFGEAALRPRKNLKLIVHLEKPAGAEPQYVERLPLKPGIEEIMGVSLRKVTIPVAAGRNLAVLVEAAVRNYVLQLRGIDSTQDFIARQSQQIAKGD